MASLTGSVFGKFQNQPIIVIFVGIILIFFGLMIMDKIKTFSLNIVIPQKYINQKNLWIIFLSGIVSGLVMGACTSPFLGVILLHIASKESILYGITLMISFSYGLGFSIILIGVFCGFLKYLPRTGVWMKNIKMILGIIITFIGVYYFVKGGVKGYIIMRINKRVIINYNRSNRDKFC